MKTSVPHRAEAAEVGGGIGRTGRSGRRRPRRRGGSGSVHGKSSIVPTVSPVSVNACAHWPIRKLIPQSLLPKPFQMQQADERRRRVSECVKPTPGQPRWNCAGSLRLQVPRAEVDPVDEPLAHHVGRVRADQQRHERDLEAAGASGSRTARGRAPPSSRGSPNSPHERPARARPTTTTYAHRRPRPRAGSRRCRAPIAM